MFCSTHADKPPTTRRYHAPLVSAVSSDDGSSRDRSPSPPLPSFSLRAPSGISDDEECGSDDEATSINHRRRSSLLAPYRYKSPTPPPVELALQDLSARLHASMHLRTRRKVSQFQRELVDIDQLERAAEQEAAHKLKKEVAALLATDKALEARRTQDRDQLISNLRVTHEQQAQRAAQQVAALEKKKREEEVDRERRRQAEEVERERKRQEATEEEARKRQQEETAAAAAKEHELLQKMEKERQAAVAAASKTATIVSAAPSALTFQSSCATAFAAAKASTLPFASDKSMRDIKRSIDKFITLNVQQISATLEQVKNKAQALTSFIAQHHDVQKTYALLTLAGKLLSQCEVQITRLHSFAFPLAEVAVAVASAHPDFLPFLLARLHDACPLSVPVYYGYRAGGDEVEYLKAMKYKIDDDDGSKETTDDYIARMQGYVMLYAAMVQSDNPSNPHGLNHGWEYVSRVLNYLPANRLTATALDAFLKVAGFKMAAVYRGQFIKLLQCVQRDYLGDLAQTNDPDVRAVATRLSTYLSTRQFMKPPEGRNMPAYDASSYDRA